MERGDDRPPQKNGMRRELSDYFGRLMRKRCAPGCADYAEATKGGASPTARWCGGSARNGWLQSGCERVRRARRHHDRTAHLYDEAAASSGLLPVASSRSTTVGGRRSCGGTQARGVLLPRKIERAGHLHRLRGADGRHRPSVAEDDRTRDGGEYVIDGQKKTWTS